MFPPTPGEDTMSPELTAMLATNEAIRILRAARLELITDAFPIWQMVHHAIQHLEDSVGRILRRPVDDGQ
jgi:hypothetical protein